MKTTCAILFFFFSLQISVFGQETENNFTSDGNKIYWQKIFETKLSFEQLQNKIKDSGIFENMNLSENKITGNLKPVTFDYKGAGFSIGSIPPYIFSSDAIGFVTIDFKEGKYRITNSNMVLIWKSTDALYKGGDKINLETFAYKMNKSIMRDNFKTVGSVIFDFTMTKMFEFKTLPKPDNW